MDDDEVANVTDDITGRVAAMGCDNDGEATNDVGNEEDVKDNKVVDDSEDRQSQGTTTSSVAYEKDVDEAVKVQPETKDCATATTPVEIRTVPVGDPKMRSKLTFEVITARVMESAGKKYVAYTITMRRAGHDQRPAVIERRYNDFCFVYECILRSFHPSVLGNFMFPKKVLLGNFKAEVISERTEAFNKFLNLIADCDSLLYSDYFYSFLVSDEHNEAVSLVKLGRYGEAVPILETLFHVREKLLTTAHVHVLHVLCELVACLTAVDRYDDALAYARVAARSLDLCNGHPDAEAVRVAFLSAASSLSTELGHDPKPYDRQLAEMRYAGKRVNNGPTLLEAVRDRYIHQASHTARLP